MVRLWMLEARGYTLDNRRWQLLLLDAFLLQITR